MVSRLKMKAKRDYMEDLYNAKVHIAELKYGITKSRNKKDKKLVY